MRRSIVGTSDASVTPDSVALLLAQSAGAPAEPVVTSGATVSRGVLVARPAEGVLGAAIHASISGTCEVLEDRIVIRAHRPKGEK